MKRIRIYFAFFIIASFLLINKSFAQIGGDNTYEFLNLPNSARIAAMGGNFLAVYDDDITVALANPSLITNNMHNNLGLSFVNYFAGINYGFAAYSRTFKKLGSFVGTMQFIEYGKFIKADAAGVQQGNFSASEYALNIGWGRKLNPHFTIGSNFKMIYSAFDEYNSFGLAVDVAGSYIHEEGLFTVSLIARNIGLQLKSYEKSNGELLPFELQLGLSKGLKHLPLRFSLLINHLEKWDLTYDDPNKVNDDLDPLTGEVNEKSGVEKFADNAMRHIVLGGELTLAKIISLRLGYNYQRRQEMKVESKLSTVGFSWGIGIRISKFNISYSRSKYHLAGSPNFITITTKLSDFVSTKGPVTSDQ